MRVRLPAWSTVHSSDGLTPLVTGMEWSLSELNVPDYLVAQESPRMEGLVAAARGQSMWDEGRYVVILVLEPYGDVWRGHAKDKRDEDVRVTLLARVGTHHRNRSGR